MNLPERHMPAVVDPMACWPVEPTAVVPAVERHEVVWVPNAYGQMVPMAKEMAPARMVREQPRDLTPQPLVDPRAQVVLAGGVAAGTAGAGVGWGVGQAAEGIATFGSSSAVVAFLVLALLLKARGAKAGRGGDTYNVTNHNRWWGKSASDIK